MDVLPLTKVDMTHVPIGDWRYGFLALHGFRVKIYGDRLFVVAALHRRTLLCQRLVQFPRSQRGTP